ncbi:MAG: extra-cytoplasmic solute receptor BugT [Hyphomicrobiales bacterium]|nr:extra-cytoplasmic solute receptor BugT [Hyphomicrobiales bacterium]
MKLWRVARTALAGAFLTLGVAAAAAQEFPTRTMTMIVPFVVGGGTDILARLVAQRLEQAWGKPVIVENRPGAGGAVGIVAAGKAEPDGHTLVMASVTNLAVNASLYKKLAYDPVKDFTPLALVAATPFVLVVNPSLPVKTVADFIAYAKARPGTINYATSGPGVPHHLYAELLKTMTGIEMTPVPYKGSLPALNDVVAGHIPVMVVDLGPALGPVQGGSVRALGVTTAKRLAVLPDVPPINDTVPGFDVSGWFMIAAPAATPRPIAEKLHAQLKQILAAPGVAEQISQAGMLPMETPSIDTMHEFIKSEISRWGAVVRKAGIEGSM